MNRSYGYNWVIAALLVLTAVTPAVVFGATATQEEDVPDGPERLFYSDDSDRETESSEDVEPSRESVSPAEYAKVADLGYPTTTSEFADYREDQHRSLSRGGGSSLVFPHSSPDSSTRIRQSHMTFMGFGKGAKPRLTGGDYPYYVAAEGTIRYYADHFFVPKTAKEDGSCDDYDYLKSDMDSDNETEYVDGERTCYTYDREFIETHKLKLAGERDPLVKQKHTGGGAPGSGSFEYDLTGLSDDQTLRLISNVTVVRTMNVTVQDWDPYGYDGYAERVWGGRWKDASMTSTEKVFTVVTSDEREVHVTDTGDIDVEQTVINTGEETQTVALTVDSPGGPDGVDRSALRNRRLLSSIQFGSDHEIRTGWKVFTDRRYSTAYRASEDGVSRIEDPKNALRANLVPGLPGPTAGSPGPAPSPVIQSSDSASTDPEVVGHESYLGTMETESLGSALSFDRRKPLFYGRLVVARASSPVTELRTIHGESIPVDVDSEIPYVEPEIAIEEVGADRVRVTVTNPDTGDPLSGVELSLFGLDRSEATTGGDGTIEGDLAGSFVRVTTERDSWRDPGSVFHGRATASKTYVPETNVVSHARELLLAGVLAAPVFVIYLWIRSLELDI